MCGVGRRQLPVEQKTGLIAEIQHYSIQDGPGIRTTIFLKGCPLHCIWCHNPEMINPKMEVWYNTRTCTSCGKCIEACPENAIKGYLEERVIDRQACLASSGCRACADACPNASMEVVGREMTVADVVRVVREDTLFYQRTGGGTCISGGDPTLQADFTVEFLEQCQDHFIDTAVETCALATWDVLSKIAQYADLLLIDIKHMDPVMHKMATGVSNRLILENIAKLADMGKKIRIRLPLIPGFNDSEENLRRTAEFMVANNLKYIDLMAFHLTGEYKYRMLGKKFECAEVEPPTPEEMAQHQALFASYGIGGTIGGTDIEPF
jgi:pyruvate formate lyase activating enzyme